MGQPPEAQSALGLGDAGMEVVLKRIQAEAPGGPVGCQSRRGFLPVAGQMALQKKGLGQRRVGGAQGLDVGFGFRVAVQPKESLDAVEFRREESGVQTNRLQALGKRFVKPVCSG